MRKYLRALLLFLSALLMIFAAFTTTTVSVPHLREDLLEINVRPTLLGAVMVGLHFGSFAMFGFGALVLVLSVRAWRAPAGVDRVLIGIIGAVYLLFGIAAFMWTGSHHTLGYVLMGLLLGGAALVK
ncbi:MAG TPA: hypothetical protein VLA93_12670 [Pyrinomonadaceae bacterium]|nr:hypothetical protein [Pyrinomonadaceae bacterium]